MSVYAPQSLSFLSSEIGIFENLVVNMVANKQKYKIISTLNSLLQEETP